MVTCAWHVNKANTSSRIIHVDMEHNYNCGIESNGTIGRISSYLNGYIELNIVPKFINVTVSIQCSIGCNALILTILIWI